MNQDLYFVPVIARALEQADRANALGRAFAEIEELGRQPVYSRRFENFHRFMAEVQRHAASDELHQVDVESIRELLVELATDTFDGNAEERQAVLDVILSQPRLTAEYEQLSATVGADGRKVKTTTINLLKGAELLTRIEFDREPPRASVGRVLPGDYSLALETGRVIWEGHLTARDLLWSAAFPERALDLAADTGGRPTTMTREEQLLGGELALRVFPGLESGRIEVELRLPEWR
jgi:hypothetical protein